MTVIDFINKLNEIGYDENTELMFSCTDHETGEWYEVPFDEIFCGEILTGSPYCNDVIDIEVNVDASKDYLRAKTDTCIGEIVDELNSVLNKHKLLRN
jgi:hypothetical protein